MTEAPAPYGTPPSSDLESQFRRVFEAAECETQAQLAECLGIRQSSVSEARRRKAVPREWLLTLFQKKGINPDWITTGKEPRLLIQAEGRPVTDYTTDELVAELVRRALQRFS